MSKQFEMCILCDEKTGRAGIAEDSMYDALGNGPYCEDCFDALPEHLKP